VDRPLRSTMPVITKEMFEQMLVALDKDGDGVVTKDEFKPAYIQTFATDKKLSDNEYDNIWASIDRDGSGDLSVDELREFFGFDGTSSGEMSEEQILKALSMQSYLFDEIMEQAEKEREEEKKEAAAPPTQKRRASVIAMKVPKPIGSKQFRQYLGIKPVRIPSKIDTVKPGENASLDLLLACETGMLSELEREIASVTRETIFCEDEVKGETPIVKLARHGLTEEIRKLIQVAETSSIDEAAKYYINMQDKKGKSPIFYATEYGQKELVDMLLVRGADPLMTDDQGWTILHTATQMAKKDSDAEIIELILTHEKVAKIKAQLTNTADDQGRTAIHIASYKDVDDVTNALLVHGMNPLAKDVHGNDAVKLASRSGRRKSKEILEEFILTGGKPKPKVAPPAVAPAAE